MIHDYFLTAVLWFQRYLPIPSLQEEELNLYERISYSFRQGPDARPIYIGAIILILFLILSYVALRLFEYFSVTEKQAPREYSILEAIQSNLELSQKQDHYLEALIEKFKDQSSYEPEVSTEYLEKFLFFTLQDLSYEPKRTIRRKKGYLPDLDPGDTLDLMFEAGEDSYTTIHVEVRSQDEGHVTVEKPAERENRSFQENDDVEIAYHKGNLTLRGDGEILAVTDDHLLIDLKGGLHFEEKRTYDRVDVDSIPCQLLVQEWEGDQLQFDGVLKDLSVEGARVLIDGSNNRLHTNMRGRIHFELPGDREMDLEIVLIHLEEVDGATSIGLEFNQPGMRNRNLLHEFLEKIKDQDRDK